MTHTIIHIPWMNIRTGDLKLVSDGVIDGDNHYLIIEADVADKAVQ